MSFENHIENRHEPDSVPTVVGRDKKHVKENNDKETNENKADVQIYVKQMSNEENSNGVDKKNDIEERDTIRKVAIPYRIAEKDAELKPRKEFTGIREISRVICDKCEISPVHESTLELQNITDENTGNKDVIIVAPRIDQKHARCSESTTPESSENKEEPFPKTDVESQGLMHHGLELRESVSTSVPQRKDSENSVASEIEINSQYGNRTPSCNEGTSNSRNDQNNW